ncbi:hypothetical protein [Rhizobium halophytocola]|uniref:Uncharacterized protein n=1 Tax=Rhizobium halophytocola TaxID=735519 RepID=A0ABS4DSH6_9HYPH|nr:hypothetical protein [Rhizobium halophytocola]MBP1848654.1 hypothetical protein [Rhizobium halophytocola]
MTDGVVNSMGLLADHHVVESMLPVKPAATFLQQSAAILRLPGLHERPKRHIHQTLLNSDAKIINFPVSGWQKKAAR